MIIELVSLADGRTFRMEPRLFGKLLHVARFNGWRPEKVSEPWPSGSWNTEMILPHIGPYLPGEVSGADAEGLLLALNKAIATGEVAAEPSVHFASLVLSQMARAGSFEVRFDSGRLSEAEQLAQATV